MILFKLIEVDLDAERKRIARVKYSKRQRAALTKLVGLFEQGKFQECLNHINSDKAFPRHPQKEYSEREHIGIEIGEVLHDMARANYYTQYELLKQAEVKLEKQKAEARAKRCPICQDSGNVMQSTGNPENPLCAVRCSCQRKKKGKH